MVGIAQHGQRPGRLGQGAGDHVEVLGAVQGNVHAGELPDLAAPHAGAIDDVLRLHGARVGIHAGDAAAVAPDRAHRRLLADGGAALACPPGERLGEVGRVDLAVAGQPEAAAHAAGVHQGPARRDLVRREQPALEAEALRAGVCLPDLVPARVRARQHDRAALQEAGGLAGLGLEAGVELGAVARQPGRVRARAQLPHQAGGVPGGAAGQPVALEQQDVVPAPVREVIGDGTADGAAADDHDPGACGQGLRGHGIAPRDWTYNAGNFMMVMKANTNFTTSARVAP